MSEPSSLALILGGVLLIVAGFGLLASGFLLGRIHRRALSIPLVGYVAMWVLMAYITAMLLSPANPPGTRDIAAAAGLVWLAVPTSCVVGLLAAVGLLLEWLFRRLRTASGPQ